jgi:hypothetical protein
VFVRLNLRCVFIIAMGLLGSCVLVTGAALKSKEEAVAAVDQHRQELIGLSRQI